MTSLPRRLVAAGSAVLQLAGLATIAAGVWFIFPPAGVVAAGICLFAVGLVIAPSRGR